MNHNMKHTLYIDTEIYTMTVKGLTNRIQSFLIQRSVLKEETQCK